MENVINKHKINFFKLLRFVASAANRTERPGANKRGTTHHSYSDILLTIEITHYRYLPMEITLETFQKALYFRGKEAR